MTFLFLYYFPGWQRDDKHSDIHTLVFMGLSKLYVTNSGCTSTISGCQGWLVTELWTTKTYCAGPWVVIVKVPDVKCV